MEKLVPLYKTILVAIDFSAQSQAVIARAMALAEPSGAKIHLIHVLEVPSYPMLEDVAVMGLPGVFDGELTHKLTAQAQAQLDDYAGQYGLENSQVVVGFPVQDIVRFAEQNNVDLIVLGRHGVSGWKRFLGSTVNEVLKEALCDVLVVKLGQQL
jgi:universal stress protein A